MYLKRHGLIPALTFAICVSLATASVHAFEPASDPNSTSTETYSPIRSWFELGAGGASDRDGAGQSLGGFGAETTIFLPFGTADPNLGYVQFSTADFSDDIVEGSAAFGVRHLAADDWIFGAWLGLDVYNTALDNTYWQSSGGFEALSHNVEMRLNWYAPLTNAQTADGQFADVIHIMGAPFGSVFMIGGEEVPMNGVDGEIGFRLPLEQMGVQSDKVEARVFAGAYHFFSDDAHDDIIGYSGRAELNFKDVLPDIPGSVLTAELKYVDDNLLDGGGQAGLRLRLLFGNSIDAASSQYLLAYNSIDGYEARRPRSNDLSRMVHRIERSHVMRTAQSDREDVEDFATGVRFDRVAYVDGSMDRDSVQSALDDAGGNSLIIADGSMGIISGNVRMSDDQTLMSGSGSMASFYIRDGAKIEFPTSTDGEITVPGIKSGTKSQFKASTQRASFFYDGTNDKFSEPVQSFDNEKGGAVIQVGNNSHIADLEIFGPGRLVRTLGVGEDGGDVIDDELLEFNHGISASTAAEQWTADENNGNVPLGSPFVVLEDLYIHDVQGDGINFQFAQNPELIVNRVSIEDIGAAITEFDGDIETEGNGIELHKTISARASFTDVSIQSVRKGISMEVSVDPYGYFENVYIAETFGEGITFESMKAGVDIPEQAAADFYNVHLLNIDPGGNDEGITFESSDNTTTTFRDVSVTNAGSEGISFESSVSSTVTMNGVQVSNSGNEAITFGSANFSWVELTDIVVQDAGQVGIDFSFVEGGEFKLVNAVISDTGDEGIDFQGADGTMATLTNVSIHNTGEAALNFWHADELIATLNDVAVSGTVGILDVETFSNTNDPPTSPYLFGASTGSNAFVPPVNGTAPTINGNILYDPANPNEPAGECWVGQVDTSNVLPNGFSGTVDITTNGVLNTITDSIGCDAAVP